MDLRTFYQKLRRLEAEISAEYAVIVSLETGDGGAAGRISEVKRTLAARMVVEGRARLATDAEAAEFRREQAKAYDQARRREAAGQNAGVLSEQDLKAIRNAIRPAKQD